MFDDGIKWEADSGRFSDYNKYDEFVYRNECVNSFLNNESKTFVIAAKGVGKTLLLYYKRYLIENNARNSLSLKFIPDHQPYVSFVESIKTTLSKEQISQLEKWEYCKRIWEFVIELSVLSYVYSNSELKNLLNDLPSNLKKFERLLRELLGSSNSIEYIFNYILALGETTLVQLIENVSNDVSKLYKKINQGVYVFLDRLDNALESSQDKIWKSIQIGLLEAAWDIMRNNHHIKIYLSVRQEAYASYTSRNKNAISASVVKMAYSKNELNKLVNHLVKFYEGYNTLEEFLGFNCFPNTITFKEENVFDFMYRYSIGRPRDFVQFCGELSDYKDIGDNDSEEKRNEVKKRIREISSETIIKSLYEEINMLMTCLTSLDTYNSFLVLLHHNVLSYDELKAVCRQFNNNNCLGNCESCPANQHPFCDLYNMGLLGIVQEPSNGFDVQQKFKMPHEDFLRGLRGNNKFFLIHPALREYICKLHSKTTKGSNYELYMGILIGSGLPWTDKETEYYEVNKLIDEIKDEAKRKVFKNYFERKLKSENGNEINGNEMNNKISIKKKDFSIYEYKIAVALAKYFKSGKLIKPKPISVFVSYASDSDEHRNKVISFVEMLRKMGFDAKMDALLKRQEPNIDKLMMLGMKCDKIIVVLSAGYKKKADNNKDGVWKEFKMILDDLEGNSTKYIFVSFEKYSKTLKKRISPQSLGNRWIVDLVKDKNENYSELVSYIKEELEYPFSEPNSNVINVYQKKIDSFNT